MLQEEIFQARDTLDKLCFDGEYEGEYYLYPDNQLFLGFRKNLSLDEMLEMPDDELRKLAVSIPFNNEPLHIIITGMQGTGKSHLASVFFDNLVRHLNFPSVLIDPSGEYRDMAKMTTNEKILKLWKKIGMYTRNPLMRIEKRKDGSTRYVNLFPIYKPLPCSFSPNEKNIYQVRIEDITVHDLFTLMNIQGGGDIVAQRRRKITEAIRRYYKDYVGDDTPRPNNRTPCPPIDEIIKYIRQGKYGEGSIILEELENLKFEGYVGDQKPPAPIVNDIAQGKCPCIQTVVDSNLSKRLLGLIQIEIEKIITERQKRTLGLKSKLNSPLQLFIDEFEIVAGREHFDFFKEIYNQCRKFGIGIIGISPSLADLHDVVLRQSDYLICFRVMPNSREEHVIRQRLGNLMDISVLNDLYDGGKNIYPKEAAIIDRSGKVIRFFPSFSISQHKGRVSQLPRRADIEAMQEIRGESVLDVDSVEGVEILGEPAEDFEEEEEEPNFAFDESRIVAEEPIVEVMGVSQEQSQLEKPIEIQTAEKAVENASSTKEKKAKKENPFKKRGEKSKKEMLYDRITEDWVFTVDLDKKLGEEKGEVIWYKGEVIEYVKRLKRELRVKTRKRVNPATGKSTLEVKRTTNK